jgi:hypothetical protein
MKSRSAQLAAIAGLAVVVVSWSASAEITAPFKSELNNTILATLSGMGVLVVLVERATEVVINAVRGNESAMKSQLAILQEEPGVLSQPYQDLAKELDEYKAGTQRLSLIVGLSIGVLIACTGIGVLDSILDLKQAVPRFLQLRRAVDILLTAGVLAGGSQAFHENVANKIRDAVTRVPSA